MEAGDETQWLELLAESDERLADLEDSADPVAQREAVKALASKWKALRRLERLPEAIAVSDELVRRLADEPSDHSRMLAMRALSQQAVDLERIGMKELIAGTAESMLRISSSVESTETVEKLTLIALLLKMAANSSDSDAVAAVNEEIIGRFAGFEEPFIHEYVSTAFLRRGLFALRERRVQEGLEAAWSLAARLEDVAAEKLSEEANLAIVFARALAGWCMFRPGWRGQSERGAFVIANTVGRARQLAAGSRFGSRFGFLNPHGGTPHGVTAARWEEWRRRLEVALELHGRVITEIGDTDDPDLQHVVNLARMHSASIRTVLGQVKRGTREMNSLVEGYNADVVQALQALAAELRADANLASHIGGFSALSLRARSLGDGDPRIERIAYDDAVEAITGATPRRSVRWAARAMRPSGKPDKARLGGAKKLLRGLRGRRGAAGGRPNPRP